MIPIVRSKVAVQPDLHLGLKTTISTMFEDSLMKVYQSPLAYRRRLSTRSALRGSSPVQQGGAAALRISRFTQSMTRPALGPS